MLQEPEHHEQGIIRVMDLKTMRFGAGKVLLDERNHSIRFREICIDCNETVYKVVAVGFVRDYSGEIPMDIISLISTFMKEEIIYMMFDKNLHKIDVSNI